MSYRPITDTLILAGGFNNRVRSLSIFERVEVPE